MLELAASAIPTGLTSRGSSSDGHGRRWLMLAVCRLKSEYIKQLFLRPDSQGLEALASGAHRRWIDSPVENAPRSAFPVARAIAQGARAVGDMPCA